MNGKSETFVVSRVFDAPRELVFDAWTQEAHLAKWFGPKGCTVVHSRLDLRPGGVYHYAMRTPDGQVMWGKWIFREIRRPERLVLVSSFSDEQGGITVHPGNPNWPRETLSTTSFEQQGDQTLLTLRWETHNATPAERETFAANHASMQQGWGGSFAQLSEYLAGLTGRSRP